MYAQRMSLTISTITTNIKIEIWIKINCFIMYFRELASSLFEQSGFRFFPSLFAGAICFLVRTRMVFFLIAKPQHFYKQRITGMMIIHRR